MFRVRHQNVMDIAYHHQETKRMDTIYRNAGETVDIQTRRLLETYRLAEDSAR